METVLITGGCGFIGLNLSIYLASLNYKVIAYDDYSSTTINHIEKARDTKNIEVIYGSVLDFNKLAEVFKMNYVDYCVHLAFPASKCSRDFTNQFCEIASTGTLNVLECCKINNVPIIYGSSISVYGIPEEIPITEETRVAPLLIYGSNKLLGELYVKNYSQLYDIDYLIVRIGDSFGKWDNRKNAINNFFLCRRMGENIFLNNDGTTIRSYIYIKDLVKIISILLIKKVSKEIINIVNSDYISIGELAEFIISMSSSKVELLKNPKLKDSRRYIFNTSKLNRFVGDSEIMNIKNSLLDYQKEMEY